MWDFSDTFVTFDNALYFFDGSGPPDLSQGPQAGIMPYLIGMEYPMALLALQQVGIFLPAALGYFGVFPISIVWASSPLPPGTVLAQFPYYGTFVAANAPMTLTVSEFPMAVAFP